MSSGGGEQTSTTQVQYSPEEQAARSQIAVDAKQIFQNGMMNASGGQYPGARPIGPSAATQNSWSWLNKATGDVAGNNAVAQDTNRQFANGSLMYAKSNPYLQNAMDAATRPMVDQFQQAGGPLSTIRNNSVNNGTYGGSRQGIAEGLASKALIDKMGDVRAAMANDGYYKGMNATQDGIKNTAMLNMMAGMPAEMQAKIGGQQEGYDQNQENYYAAIRNFQQNSQWDQLKNFANVIYGGSNGTTRTTQSLPEQDNTGQIVGTVGTMALMAMMM